MRIHIASDHAGFELKEALVEHLVAAGHDVVNHGALTYDPQDDYPAFCIAAAEATVADGGGDGSAVAPALGIVIGGSGNGEQIAANKVRGVRAALAWNLDTARLARQHNDANVLAIGGRMHTVEEATSFVDAFVAEPFSQDPRHARRIAQLTEYEGARG
ncbi:ribose-5-phosphate isomerase [Miniimonas arenae]|uniref:Ribose-5-phosphate isomerase B n=2 Tax=Miniimonas arenae TaxID=676201 RepID=A0A5C5BDU0_9MICO|nr:MULTISPECIES: ribose-5-phosphate isomerase [Miniimonas]TNU74075.1 ribose-5-phosphate isomerase [Miniimonas arenae]